MGNERRCPLSRNQSVTREAQGGIRMFKTEARSLKTETRDFRKCDITTGRQPGIAIANIHRRMKGYAGTGRRGAGIEMS